MYDVNVYSLAADTIEQLNTKANAALTDIDARVTSLVSYQQAREVEMREASTLEALEAIPVDYDTVEAESA